MWVLGTEPGLPQEQPVLLTADSPLAPGILFCFYFSLGCPGTLYVDKAGLELMEILLSLPPECWD